MPFQFTSAKKSSVKLKLALMGASGSGKTMSALRLAKGITGNWQKVGIIDTENRSALLYSRLGDFQHLHLTAPFTPERYIEAIEAAEQAGIECLIVDSASHEWSGTGGCLEINERIAASNFKGNTWSAWSITKARHAKFVQKFLQSDMHVIACVRTKTETNQVNGKVIKVGTKEIQSEDFEYEFTTVFQIDKETHYARATKDRTGLFDVEDSFLITELTGKKLLEWCQDSDRETATIEQIQMLNDLREFVDELAQEGITNNTVSVLVQTPIRDNTEKQDAERTLQRASKETSEMILDFLEKQFSNTDHQKLQMVKKMESGLQNCPEEDLSQFWKRIQRMYLELYKKQNHQTQQNHQNQEA